MCIIHNKYYRNHKELKCDALSEKILPHCLRATDTTKQKWFLTVNFPLLSTAKPKLTNNFQCTTMKKKLLAQLKYWNIFVHAVFLSTRSKSLSIPQLCTTEYSDVTILKSSSQEKKSKYSKASRYAASRSADLGDKRFSIGSQNTWDTRILAKSLEDTRSFIIW